MSFREEVAEATAEARKTLLVDSILAGLGKKEAADLLEVLVDPSVSARAIAVVLNRRGIDVSEGAVSKWRRRNR